MGYWHGWFLLFILMGEIWKSKKIHQKSQGIPDRFPTMPWLRPRQASGPQSGWRPLPPTVAQGGDGWGEPWIFIATFSGKMIKWPKFSRKMMEICSKPIILWVNDLLKSIWSHHNWAVHGPWSIFRQICLKEYCRHGFKPGWEKKVHPRIMNQQSQEVNDDETRAKWGTKPCSKQGTSPTDSSVTPETDWSLDMWVCLKIVYPYTQWLMIIIPIKWLFHWEY